MIFIKFKSLTSDRKKTIYFIFTAFLTFSMTFLLALMVLKPGVLNYFLENIKKANNTVNYPKGFPQAIPVYPGAALSSYFDEEMEGEIKHQYRATWECKDGVPKVMDWYLNIKDKNWTVVTPTSDPGAMGAQDAVFGYREWKIYIIVQQKDSGGPTYIYVSMDPK